MVENGELLFELESKMLHTTVFTLILSAVSYPQIFC